MKNWLQTVVTAGLVLLAPLVVRAERFLVVYDDGTTQTGPTVNNTFGWSFVTNAPEIGSERMKDRGEKARVIRDFSVPVRRVGPSVHFANGDLLPGRVTGYLPADEASGLDKRLLVQVGAPLGLIVQGGIELPVRADRVARIESDPTVGQALGPGMMRLRDGKTFEFKAVRWGESGLKVLTEDGILNVTYDELTDYQAKTVDRWTAFLEDAAVPCPDPDSPIVRLQFRDGAVLTTRRALYVELGPNMIAVQPAWAYGGLRFISDLVGSRLRRRPNEMPLSLMPVTRLEEKTFTGFLWPSQVDANVRGGDLTAGALVSPVGFGTHAYSALAVALPPGAQAFTSWVGLDRLVGEGGCVHATLRADSPGGAELWRKAFIRGIDAPTRVGPIDVSAAKQLVMVTDFAHDGRPQGADPLDIRDDLNWLGPMVTVKEVPEVESMKQAVPILDQLADWQVPEGFLDGAMPVPAWVQWRNWWTRGIALSVEQEVRLKRRVTITHTNAWMKIRASRGRGGTGGHEMIVLADGKHVETLGWIARTEEGAYEVRRHNLTTHQEKAGFLHIEDLGLGSLVGKTVDMEIQILPIGRVEGKPLPYLLLENIHMLHMTLGAPEHQRSVLPEVSITTLKPSAVLIPTEGHQLQKGKNTNGSRLKLYTCPYEDGYGVPAGSEITYNLDPSWKRLVAVIGFTHEGGGHTGPFSILFDGEEHWVSEDGRPYHWKSLARQIDVPIPEGSKTITLRVAGDQGYGGWADCGFRRDQP